MMVNKAQGQTIPNAGVYLPEPVFSHGQLYVALSRATTRSNIRILAIPPSDKKDNKKKTKIKDTYTKKYCLQGGPNSIKRYYLLFCTSVIFVTFVSFITDIVVSICISTNRGSMKKRGTSNA
jgi:hypothetical protein